MYTLLDFGNGKRLEQWGTFRLVRPDPTAEAPPRLQAEWGSAHAMYVGEKGQGEWKKSIDMPEHWLTDFGDLKLVTRLAPYKHTGVFPEQEQNWRWMRERAKQSGRQISILNLFAYTGGATIALAKDGHSVTHVDSSKPVITWAKENALANGIAADRTRWILDDALEFATRELKRGKHYDAILLDPPAYGHSPSGKAWRSDRDLKPLLETCAQLFSDQPVFLVLNGYAQQDTPESFHRLLSGILHAKLKHNRIDVHCADLSLSAKDGRTLSTGTVARCTF